MELVVLLQASLAWILAMAGFSKLRAGLPSTLVDLHPRIPPTTLRLLWKALAISEVTLAAVFWIDNAGSAIPLLMAGFYISVFLYSVWAVRNGATGQCSCFGQIALGVWGKGVVLRNFVLMFLAVLVVPIYFLKHTMLDVSLEEKLILSILSLILLATFAAGYSGIRMLTPNSQPSENKRRLQEGELVKWQTSG